jgi:SAM-dependent methyltransferase
VSSLRLRQAKICPYVPSTQGRIGQLASFAGITADDVVLDIGCGDGRALLALAETVGCKGVGIDIDPELVEIAACSARAAGLSFDSAASAASAAAASSAVAAPAAVAPLLRYEVADMCAPAGSSVEAEGDASSAGAPGAAPASAAGGAASAAGAAGGAVNKLDEYFMAHDVTVVLIYLVADALIMLYPHLHAAIQAHCSRRRSGEQQQEDSSAASAPLVRVVTQVYHYDFGGSESLFAPQAEGQAQAQRQAGPAAPSTSPAPAATPPAAEGGGSGDDLKNAPMAKDGGWKLIMYPDWVYLAHPPAAAAGGAAAAKGQGQEDGHRAVRPCKISENQVELKVE